MIGVQPLVDGAERTKVVCIIATDDDCYLSDDPDVFVIVHAGLNLRDARREWEWALREFADHPRESPKFDAWLVERGYARRAGEHEAEAVYV